MTEHQDDTLWQAYYAKVANREPRALFQRLMGALTPGDTPGLAIDLGCGDGTETLALLAAGWRVLALDGAPAAIARVRDSARPADADRLQTQQATFTDAVLPPANLIYAGLSLPFCAPGDFPRLWSKVRDALRPGARFAGHFFGVRDSWAERPEMTFHTADELRALFSSLNIEFWQETEEDRPSAFEAMKHFHYFEVIAQRADSRV